MFKLKLKSGLLRPDETGLLISDETGLRGDHFAVMTASSYLTNRRLKDEPYPPEPEIWAFTALLDSGFFERVPGSPDPKPRNEELPEGAIP